MRRKDTGRPGNGGKYDHAPGARSSASLDPAPPTPTPARRDTTARDAIVEDVLSARDVEHDAARALRSAEDAQHRYGDIPIVNTLIAGRVRRRRGELSRAQSTLERAESRLTEMDRAR